MKKIFLLGAAASLAALSACNTSPREQAADNIESNTEAMADNMEDVGDTMNSSGEAMMDNKADAMRETGQNQAEDLRTNDADTNLSNGM